MMLNNSKNKLKNFASRSLARKSKQSCSSFASLVNRKILILGFGKEGKDTYLALRKLFPKKILGIADKLRIMNYELRIMNYELRIMKLIQKDKNVKCYFGKNYLKSLKSYDLIIKTPGIPSRIIKPYLSKKQKITSQTEIFLENCPGKIIGVTGTKGKGTTSSLIFQILKEAGLKVRLIGNIGKPVFQLLLKSKKEDIFVYELSSHQLENLKQSPHIAVFLNLYPAHLDYYKNFRPYQKAKENIAKWQTKEDFLICNSDQREVKEIAKNSVANKIFFGSKDLKKLEKIIAKKEIPLKGNFNFLNVLAAVSVSQIFGIPKATIRRAIRSFKALPHRLEFVGQYRGIEFYNDSLATVLQAAIEAIEALKDKIETLIFGGQDIEGLDFSLVAKNVLKNKIKILILFPETGKKLEQEIKKIKTNRALPKNFFVYSMKDAVKIAYENTKKGKVCLLAPGTPSFNLFRNYKERGNLFKKYVKYYGHK